MKPQDCLIVNCPVTDDVATYVGTYNLQSTVPYANTLMPPTPVGYGYYISVPPGTFNITVTPSTDSFTLQTVDIPCPNGSSFITGCDRSYSFNVPTGSTPAQIQQLLDNSVQQVAVIKGKCCVGFPLQVVTTWTNTPQSAGCDGFGGLKVVGTLPSYATASFTQVTINAGVITSTVSQADADLQAGDAAIQLINSAIIECGWWNTQQTCTDGSTVAANTYFSTVSQDDANAQAIAGGCSSNCPAAMEALVGLAYSPAVIGDGISISGVNAVIAFESYGAVGTGGGLVYVNFSIVNDTASDFNYVVTVTLNSSDAGDGSLTSENQCILYYGPDTFDNTLTIYDLPSENLPAAGHQWVNNITIPAMTTFGLQFSGASIAGTSLPSLVNATCVFSC